MGRVSTISLVVSAAVLGRVEDATAGGTHGAPQVRVVAPGSTNGVALEPDDLPAPQLEVVKAPERIDLPIVPAFELPAVGPGLHAPQELRVRGARWLGTELAVTGYVSWIYDCRAALASANPDASDAELATAMRRDPSLCDRPMFALGDAPTASRDASIIVVGAPAMPRLGDHAVVAGTWTAQPGGDVLVYRSLAAAPSTAPAAAAQPTALEQLERRSRENQDDGRARVALDLEVDPEPAPAMRRLVEQTTLDASIVQLNACNRAVAARDLDAAVAACRTATEIWPDNHLAWYALASVHLARRDWPAARAAADNAVKLRPDRAMYQLYLGIARYERGERDAAREALTAAVRLAPMLWRAHYYLGRVHRDLDDDRRAALQFTAAIKANPGYRFAYIALAEIYRRWDYTDAALVVATIGAARVPAGDAADLWFEAGMACDAKHLDARALDAFSRAIAIRPDHALAKLQRAELAIRTGDLAAARRDLDDVVRSTDPRVASARPLAGALLAQLARLARPADAAPCRACLRTGFAASYRPRFRPVSTSSTGLD